MAKTGDEIPLDDPAGPAILRWVVWALLYLAACCALLVAAGWGVGRLLFRSGAFVPIACGVILLLAVSRAVAWLEHLANRHIAKGHRSPAQWDKAAVDAAILAISAAVFVVYRGRGGDLSATATTILLPAAVALWHLKGALDHPAGWWMLKRFARVLERFGDHGFHTRSIALQKLCEANWKGVLPRDWDPELLESACGAPKPDEWLATPLFFAYFAALDRGDIVAAGAWLDRIGSIRRKLRRSDRAGLACEKAFYLARYKASPGPARGVLRAFHGAAHNPNFFRRASAAIYLAEHRYEPLRAAARTALSSKPRKHPNGVVQLHDRLVREMLAEAEHDEFNTPVPADRGHGS